jgi:hypothetical protein
LNLGREAGQSTWKAPFETGASEQALNSSIGTRRASANAVRPLEERIAAIAQFVDFGLSI